MKNKKSNLIKKEERRIKREWKNILFNSIFAILALLITILFYKNILLATILLSVVSLIGLIKWKSWITLIIFIFGSLLGAVSEMIAINYGVWSYSLSNFFNIPIWLFLIWGMAAGFIYQTALEIKKLVHKK